MYGKSTLKEALLAENDLELAEVNDSSDHELDELPKHDVESPAINDIQELDELPADVQRFLARAGLTKSDLHQVGLDVSDIQPMLRAAWLKYLRLAQVDNTLFKSLMLPMTRVWPRSKSVLFTSPWILRQAYITNDFIKGVQVTATPLWSSVTYASIIMDWVNHATCPQGNKAEALLLFLGVSSRSQILSLLLSSKKMAYVPSLLFSLPLLWGSIKALIGALDARPLTKERAKAVIEALQRYQPHPWQDFGRWFLPFSPLERHFNQLVRALTFDGREIIEAGERRDMAIALKQRARDAKGFTQLFAMEGLAEIVNGIALKDFAYLNQQEFKNDTKAAVLFSKQQALSTLRQLADNYLLPYEPSRLKPLVRYIYANYLLWYIGQPASLLLRPAFWAVEGAKAYATLSILSALVRAAVEAIIQRVKKNQCENTGNVWLYSNLVGKHECTRCGDLPIAYKDTFTDQTCFESYLRHPKTVDNIVKVIQRFDLKDIQELNLVRHQLTNPELALVLEALAKKKLILQRLELNWESQLLNSTDAQRLIQSLPALQPQTLRLRTQMIDDVMAKAIGNTSFLTQLDLSSNGLTEEGLKALNGHYPTSLINLNLANNRLALNEVNLTDFLQRSPESLDLRNNTIAVEQMRKLYPAILQSSLVAINLPKITGDFNATELISYLPWKNLVYLRLADSIYDAQAADDLGLSISRSKLATLIFDNVQLTVYDPEQFAKRIMRPSLTRFTIFNSNFDDRLFIPLARHLPVTSTRTLAIGAIPITDTSVAVLGHCLNQTQLNHLAIMSINITPLGIEALMKGIQQSQIKIIEAIGLSITDESAAIIAHYLLKSPIEELSLYNNGITDQGAVMLAESLPYKISALSLERNKLGNQGTAALALKLKINQQLRILDLSHNNITDITPLIEHLSDSSLTQLGLNNNWIGDDNIEALANTLAKSLCKPPISLVEHTSNLRAPRTNLFALQLRDNPIGLKGAQALCQVLPSTLIPIEYEVSNKWQPIVNTPLDFRTCQTSSASSLKAPWPYLVLYRGYQTGVKLAIESYRSLQQAMTYDEEPISQALVISEELAPPTQAAYPSLSQVATYGALYLTVGYLFKEGIGNWWQTKAPNYITTDRLVIQLSELAEQSETLVKGLKQFDRYHLSNSQQDLLVYLQANLTDSQTALAKLRYKRRVTEQQLQVLDSDLADIDFGIKELRQEVLEQSKQTHSKLRFFACKTVPSYITAKNCDLVDNKDIAYQYS
jgi:hypothetical protein